MFCEWLNIDSFHPFFKSQKMDCLGIFPNEKTQLWLKNHRHVWKFTNNSLKISFSIRNEGPEIPPTNEEIELEFYLGINDLSFQNYTVINDSPIFYKQHHFNIEMKIEDPTDRKIQLNEGEILDTDKMISLPVGYQKMGNLKIKFSKPLDFFVSCINKNTNKIVFEATDKSYFLFYAIKNESTFKKIPNLIEEESQKVTFSALNVDNSNFIYFKSEYEVKLTQLNSLEPYCCYVSDDGVKSKLRVKTPNFSLNDLSKSPTYPHFSVLLKEIKV